MLIKPIRNAASMIILARDASKSSRFNYKVLKITEIIKGISSYQVKVNGQHINIELTYF
jgi:hypothetical protein